MDEREGSRKVCLTPRILGPSGRHGRHLWACLLATDEHGGYKAMKGFPQHRTVNHKAKEYVVGAVHTNTIEGFWSLFKRGIMGSFHKVSKKYLPLYVAEFEFRYNNRHNPKIFEAAIAGC